MNKQQKTQMEMCPAVRSLVFGFLGPVEVLGTCSRVCSSWNRTQAQWHSLLFSAARPVEKILRASAQPALREISAPLALAAVLLNSVTAKLEVLMFQPTLHSVPWAMEIEELYDFHIRSPYLLALSSRSCKQLSLLTCLTTLALPNCDADFRCIAALSNLRHLDLQGSAIPDASLGILAKGCQELQSLNLCQCLGLTASMHVSSFLKLSDLNLARTAVSDDVLSSLPLSITRLNLCACGQITVNSLAVLGRLWSLRELCLIGCNRLNNIAAGSRFPLTTLTTLHLSTGWPGIARSVPLLKRLTILGGAMRDLGIVDGSPAIETLTLLVCTARSLEDDFNTIVNLPTLSSLVLGSTNEVSPKAISGLALLPRLRTLKLISLPFEDEDLHALSVLQQLEDLGCAIIGSGLAHLRPLASLHTLTLSRCPLLEPECLASTRALLALRAINFFDCPSLPASLEGYVCSWAKVVKKSLH